MPRSVRLCTTAKLEAVKTLVGQPAEQPGLPAIERDKLAASQTDLKQTLRKDHRRARGAAHLHLAAS
jgi:hypothetical protein